MAGLDKDGNELDGVQRLGSRIKVQRGVRERQGRSMRCMGTRDEGAGFRNGAVRLRLDITTTGEMRGKGASVARGLQSVAKERI